MQYKVKKYFLAPIFTKYAARSRDLLQSYLETGSRPMFLNYTFILNNETHRMRHSSAPRAPLRTYPVLSLMPVIIFFRDP